MTETLLLKGTIQPRALYHVSYILPSLSRETWLKRETIRQAHLGSWEMVTWDLLCIRTLAMITLSKHCIKEWAYTKTYQSCHSIPVKMLQNGSNFLRFCYRTCCNNDGPCQFFDCPLKKNKSRHYSHYLRYYSYLCSFQNLCHMLQKGFLEIRYMKSTVSQHWEVQINQLMCVLNYFKIND